MANWVRASLVAIRAEPDHSMCRASFILTAVCEGHDDKRALLRRTELQPQRDRVTLAPLP